jgi:hypothetical protein
MTTFEAIATVVIAPALVVGGFAITRWVWTTVRAWWLSRGLP